ncbi:MAG TPA: nucleoside diphosphate kinase regulator [Acetobacteraceae bacterium]|jgi:regulator of nucleoside diphosphate kinase
MPDRTFATDLTQLPRLLLTSDDHDRLTGLARAMATGHERDDARLLMDELYRADIVPPYWMPEGIVRMNSHIEFRDDRTGRIRRVQLVYPQQADIGQGRISVLSPVGTALLGLAEGQSIGWSSDGRRRPRLTVVRVSNQPFEVPGR